MEKFLKDYYLTKCLIFIEYKLTSSNQSGFKPCGTCINQLSSVSHEICEPFGVGLEVRSVFLDISKAFNKVWHDVIIFKLTQNGMLGNLLNLLQDFLKERKQRVVLTSKSLHGKISMLQYLKFPSFILYCL